jgi:pimeloyl-ACP methyl ester carboxylesterase
MRRMALWSLCYVILGSAGRLQAEDQFFASNGVKIRYIVQGQGDPVLLIHGFTANIEMQWGAPGVIKALAKDYQVIALDNRGHGKSGKPHDAKKYGLEMVEDQVRLLDHLKIKKAHVVGYSMGALITSKLLTTHPDRLITATLGGAAGIREGADTRFFDELAESLEQGKGAGALIAFLTPAGRPKPTEEQLKAINTAMALTNDMQALSAVVRGFKDLSVSDAQLKANKVPTLSLIGEIDPLKKGVDEIKDKLALLKIVVIPGADHMNAFVNPMFNTSLKEFLGQNSAPKKTKQPAIDSFSR